jgi:cytochrome c
MSGRAVIGTLMMLAAGVLGVASLEPAPRAAASGDAVRGQQLWEALCTGCHALDQNQVGPRHRGVYGRKAGSLADYDYSPALKASEFVWCEDTLDRWLTNPEALVPGQKMGFTVSSPQNRADIVAYLKSLSAK